eukprot:TRINITY_DN490_c0_g1_i12.p1 TRINITY_DN490_c0_g1~~TRINITY_DN490_c0_g1_i12.p1  ORF type:complete len:651 (-),score=207.97 TRINITY_DN490_c0_g1_i12:338-2290(-)
MADQTDSLTLNEEKLDYEVDEGDQVDDARVDTPNSSREEISSPQQSRLDKSEDGEVADEGEKGENDLDGGGKKKKKRDDGEEEDGGDGELESGEELEDGEISDEDEALRNERNEPKAVCRFYNRGHCTWGTSCRFLHPGVLDKGNYNMFATPRPILPGQQEKEEVEEPEEVEREPVLMRPPPPAYETAWERGLRQAKEMRRRSHKRREMDVEYEEKKSNLSLTQIELDKENDYYTRPASPAHTHDPYADDDYPADNYDNYYPAETRRVAPPPPADFIARGERAAAAVRSGRGYSESPPPRTRRVAPPRSPSPREDPYKNRFRGGEDWADPWMRSKDDKSKGGRSRRRSYSSGSSRSSSSRSSSSASSLRRQRKYSTSPSSRSSSSSRSRSRSSTPEGIPRRSGGPSLPPPVKNTAPLQKRLGGVVSQQSTGGSRHSGGGGKKWNNPGGGGGEPAFHHGAVSVKLEGERKSGGPGGSGEQHKVSQKQPREPVKLNLPKNQSKVALKTPSGKPSNQEVLEKLGTRSEDLPENERRKRKLEQNPDHPDSIKQRKLENEELMETLKQRLKSNLEAKQAKEAEAKSAKAKKQSSDIMAADKKADKKKKGAAGGAAAPGGAAPGSGDAKAKRKEELLKQLKAVEEAIHRKRTKLEK